MAFITLPIGIAGSLSDSACSFINTVLDIDSRKHEDKMTSYIGIYFIFIGILFLYFSTFVHNIKFSNSTVDGIVLSWLVIGSGLFVAIFYGIKSHFSKK